MWKKNALKNWKKPLLEQKYAKSLIEASILKAKEMHRDILKQPKTTKKWRNCSFHYCIQSKNFSDKKAKR